MQTPHEGTPFVRGFSDISPLLPGVRLLAANEDLRSHAGVLTRALAQDDFMLWLVRRANGHEARMYKLLVTHLTQIAQDKGELYTTETNQGLAVWMPPGKSELSLPRQLSLAPALASVVGYHRIPAILRGFAAVQRRHPKEGRAYYLNFLGVDPPVQGKGLGTALMQPVLARCDAQKLGAFLETSNPRNLPLYERVGFRVTEVHQIPHGGPKSWAMYREPRG
jgi:ribosomal protein S18 acetylase RimI-like enzyme